MNQPSVLDYEEEEQEKQYLQRSYTCLKASLLFLMIPILVALILGTELGVFLLLIGSSFFLLVILFTSIGCYDAIQSFRYHEGKVPQRIIALVGNIMVLLSLIFILYSAMLPQAPETPPMQATPIIEQ